MIEPAEGGAASLASVVAFSQKWPSTAPVAGSVVTKWSSKSPVEKPVPPAVA